jgi:hypothetical protein
MNPMLGAQGGILQLNLNPQMVQQQTALELLQLARQQRLDAIQAQQAELDLEAATHGPRLNTLKSFKQVYTPQRAPATSLTLPGAVV